MDVKTLCRNPGRAEQAGHNLRGNKLIPGCNGFINCGDEMGMNNEIQFARRECEYLDTIKGKTLKWQLLIFFIIMVINIMTKIMHVQKIAEPDAVISFPVINEMNNKQRQFRELVERYNIKCCKNDQKIYS